MLFNVAQLLKAPVGSTRTHAVEGTSLALDALNPTCTAGGEVMLVRTNRSILVTGTLMAYLKGICSRCLEEFSYSETFALNEEYFPTVDVITGGPLPAPEDPTSFTIDQNHTLDLTEAIRQYIILAMPLQPLCREDCAGLCPLCGQDLNVRPCDCVQRDMDPRWATLQDLAQSHGYFPHKGDS